jgi:hypothetical protein
MTKPQFNKLMNFVRRDSTTCHVLRSRYWIDTTCGQIQMLKYVAILENFVGLDELDLMQTRLREINP